MKVCWFHLMPYPYLPDDFKQKYRSVWVDVPSTLYDPAKGHVVYNDYLDELEFAEQVGFDGLCVNEHHANAYGLMPSPNLMAAALSRRTAASALVVLGNSIALYNPPLRVAEEFAMLDVMSGGRLVAGFPVGSSMDTNFAYGAPPASLRDKYREAHDLIIQAWTRPEPFSFNGKYTQLRYVNIWPRPLQQPHPPVWTILFGTNFAGGRGPGRDIVDSGSNRGIPRTRRPAWLLPLLLPSQRRPSKVSSTFAYLDRSSRTCTRLAPSGTAPATGSCFTTSTRR
jgi:hypothetical protein